MILYFRFFWTLLRAVLAQRQGKAFDVIQGVSRLQFRAGILDCDFNMHMTQSRYAAFGDLGRIDHAIRSGFGSKVQQLRLTAIVGAIHTEFRREIKPFERFTLETRILGWEGSKIVCEHRYVVNRKGESVLAAKALVRCGLYDRQRKQFVTSNDLSTMFQIKTGGNEFTDDIKTFAASKIINKNEVNTH